MNALTAVQILDGLEKIWGNADELIADAHVLRAAGRPTRAYTLAHLAREELSKIGMLFPAGVNVCRGAAVDWKSLWKRFTSHKKKLRLESVDNALLALRYSEGDDDQVLSHMIASGDHRDNKKNWSLYVSFEEGQFVVPSSAITAESAVRTILLAEIRLLEMEQHVKSFAEIVKLTPEQVRERFKHVDEFMKMDGAGRFRHLRAMQLAIQQHIAKKAVANPGAQGKD